MMLVLMPMFILQGQGTVDFEVELTEPDTGKKKKYQVTLKRGSYDLFPLSIFSHFALSSLGFSLCAHSSTTVSQACMRASMC